MRIMGRKKFVRVELNPDLRGEYDQVGVSRRWLQVPAGSAIIADLALHISEKFKLLQNFILLTSDGFLLDQDIDLCVLDDLEFCYPILIQPALDRSATATMLKISESPSSPEIPVRDRNIVAIGVGNNQILDDGYSNDKDGDSGMSETEDGDYEDKMVEDVNCEVLAKFQLASDDDVTMNTNVEVETETTVGEEIKSPKGSGMMDDEIVISESESNDVGSSSQGTPAPAVHEVMTTSEDPLNEKFWGNQSLSPVKDGVEESQVEIVTVIVSPASPVSLEAAVNAGLYQQGGSSPVPSPNSSRTSQSRRRRPGKFTPGRSKSKQKALKRLSLPLVPFSPKSKGPITPYPRSNGEHTVSLGEETNADVDGQFTPGGLIRWRQVTFDDLAMNATMGSLVRIETNEGGTGSPLQQEMVITGVQLDGIVCNVIKQDKMEQAGEIVKAEPEEEESGIFLIRKESIDEEQAVLWTTSSPYRPESDHCILG